MVALALSLAASAHSQSSDGGGGAIAGIFGLLFTLIWLGLVLVVIAGIWKTFTKAGEPGWAAIVPIYNLIVMLKIAGKPLWWVVLMLIPFVNFIVAIMVCISLAENFGKSSGFGIGLALLGFIFFPMLGFGDAVYQGGGARAAA